MERSASDQLLFLLLLQERSVRRVTPRKGNCQMVRVKVDITKTNLCRSTEIALLNNFPNLSARDTYREMFYVKYQLKHHRHAS